MGGGRGGREEELSITFNTSCQSSLLPPLLSPLPAVSPPLHLSPFPSTNCSHSFFCFLSSSTFIYCYFSFSVLLFSPIASPPLLFLLLLLLLLLLSLLIPLTPFLFTPILFFLFLFFFLSYHHYCQFSSLMGRRTKEREDERTQKR